MLKINRNNVILKILERDEYARLNENPTDFTLSNASNYVQESVKNLITAYPLNRN